MSRIAFGLLGIVMALVPQRVLDLYERLALEEPEAGTAKSWVVPMIRAEGIVYAMGSLIGGRAYGWLLNLAGPFGALAMMFPRRYLEYAAEIIYEDAGELTWNERFVTAVRVLGAVSVLLAVTAFRDRRVDARAEADAVADEDPAAAEPAD